MHTIAGPRLGHHVRDAAHAARTELTALDESIRTTERDWRALVGALSPAQINRRPAPDRWSVSEHLAHLNIVDASYLPHLDAMLARGRADGLFARGKPRHPWFGALLVRGVEPPVRLRVRTPHAHVPPSFVDAEAALAEFSQVRVALRERIARADGLDPGRMRARYVTGIGPAKLCVLSFGQWVALAAGHDRRHRWLAERVIGAPGFPKH
jgi:hypothetical protein